MYMTVKNEHVVVEGVEKRWCGKCKGYKELEKFGYSKSTWDNLRPTCKVCLKESNALNKERRTEYNKQYWQESKEHQQEKNRKWRQDNPEKVKESMKRWLEKNKEYKKQKDKEYREAHKEAYRVNQRRWVRENYHRMKEENGPEFQEHKLKSNLGRRIREILGQQKSERCLEYVGCSLEDLRRHIETTFTECMSWDNYGTWHIDHKIPCAAFNMLDPKEQKACFYYKNLQALWAKDNVIKKDKYTEEDKVHYLKELENYM
jgi:hypothetical protein